MFKATWAAALICASVMAHAGDDKYEKAGFQFGAAIGRSSLSLSGENDDGGFKTSANNFGYKIFGGFRFNQYLAVEAAWEESELLVDRDDGGTAASVNTDDDFAVRLDPKKIYSASVVGSLPFADVFAVQARVGAAHWDTDTTFVWGQGTSAVGFVVNDKGTDLKWGVGLTARLDGALVRLEYEQIMADTDILEPTLPLDLKFRQVTLGVAWLF